MPWWTWVALAVFFAAGAVSAAVRAVLALRTLRAMRTVQAGLLQAVEDLSREAETLADRAERASTRVDAIERRLADVGRSAEQLGVLKWALGDSLDALTRLRQAVPRK
jgi:uncharacterized protein YlxW (UPF0749 family)